LLAQNPINLLALTDKTINFAAAVVDPGGYEFIHINIDERRSNVVEKERSEVTSGAGRGSEDRGRFYGRQRSHDDDHAGFDAKSSLVRLGNANGCCGRSW
jgi:hypothetical protein